MLDGGGLTYVTKENRRRIETLIITCRGTKVILDETLAGIYGVTTKRLNEQVKRNSARFPEDFCFQLTREELVSIRSQFATAGKRNVRRTPAYQSKVKYETN